MTKFDSDYSRPMHEGDIVLKKDDPEERTCALRYLVSKGASDLADMLGVNDPIPNYGGKQ